MEETDELRRFREEWRREVNSRLHVEPPAESSASEVHLDTIDETQIPAIAVSTESNNVTQSTSGHLISTTSSASASQSTALGLYSQAVQAEAQGQLDHAIMLYRKAFRLDGNVDKKYHRISVEREMASDFGTLSLHDTGRRASKRHLSSIVSATSRASGSSPKQSVYHHALQAILDEFPPASQLAFFPEIENEPVHINKLPDELLILTLHYFVHIADTRSIERFGLVSKRARLLTLDSSLWRALVQLIYVAPQLPYSTITLSSFHEDYRYYYTHQPRVRLDGVYIAVCHYLRTGHSENAWVHITHFITYHRYLRFLPNGLVLSFLSSDVTASPADVIPHLRLGEDKLKGLHAGTWRVELASSSDREERIDDDGGDISNYDGPFVKIDGLMDGGSSMGINGTNGTATAVAPKYSFNMRLGLRSRPMGRWNKLDILDFFSVQNATGEEVSLPLKHEKSYWFSKVRSYGSGMD